MQYNRYIRKHTHTHAMNNTSFTIRFRLYWFVYCKDIWEAYFADPPSALRDLLICSFIKLIYHVNTSICWLCKSKYEWPFNADNSCGCRGRKGSERDNLLVNRKLCFFTRNSGDIVLLTVWFLPVWPLWVTVDQQDGSMSIRTPFPGSLKSFQQNRRE